MNLDAPVDIAGVDGCPGGWVAVVARRGAAAVVETHARFADLISGMGPDAIVVVDMPIGLPDRTQAGGRGPEALVRPLLGMRQSSVFSIPSRAAVYAATAPFTTLEAWYRDHRAASAVARATSDPPRAVSIQAFGIFAKIRELDGLLSTDARLAARVIESHPELAFWRLNGGRPMTTPKKVRGQVNPEGIEARRRLLCDHGLAAALLDGPPPRGVGIDDLVDAAAMLTVAARHASGGTRSFPDPPGVDSRGLPIAIWV